MDAKGVDRPVAVVVGRPSALIHALSAELAMRGHAVHLSDELASPARSHDPHLTAHRYVGGSSADVVERVGADWAVAVIASPGSRTAADLVAAVRPGASVLVVAHDAEQRRAADRLALLVGDRGWATVLAPRSSPIRWPGRHRPSGSEQAERIARRGLRGLSQRRRRVWFDAARV